MKYRYKPVEVEAIRWVSGNDAQLEQFLGHRPTFTGPDRFLLRTVEGTQTVTRGDYVIKDGDAFYAARADVFDRVMERAVP